MTLRRTAVLVVLLGGGLLAAVILWTARSQRISRDSVAARPQPPLTGPVAAAVYCQTCHLLPSPDALDKKTWRDELLPKMRFFTGMSRPATNNFQDLGLLLEANVFPTAPLMPREHAASPGHGSSISPRRRAVPIASPPPPSAPMRSA